MNAKRGLQRSLRRHVKLKHTSVGGAGHMGPLSTRKISKRAADDKPNPMKVPLREYVATDSATAKHE